MDAGRLAPSGSNGQPWDFIAITDRETIIKMVKVNRCLEQAGAVIAVVLDPASRWWLEDGSAAVENMLLAVTALGYGAVWLEGNVLPHEDEMKRLLNVPSDKRMPIIIPIGVPTGPVEKPKKSLAEVLHWEKYGGR
jgi:nitroreductase